MIAVGIARRSGEFAPLRAKRGRSRYRGGVSSGLQEVARGWQREAIRRAALPFGLACGCLPALDVCEQYSVVEQIAAGLGARALPAVPTIAWLQLGYFAAVAAAAAVLLTRRPRRGRWRLFAAGALLHAGYALLSGLRPATTIGLMLFAWSFVALQAADQLEGDGPGGHV